MKPLLDWEKKTQKPHVFYLKDMSLPWTCDFRGVTWRRLRTGYTRQRFAFSPSHPKPNAGFRERIRGAWKKPGPAVCSLESRALGPSASWPGLLSAWHCSLCAQVRAVHRHLLVLLPDPCPWILCLRSPSPFTLFLF